MGSFCYRCMLPTIQNGTCTRCGEAEEANSSNGENALQPGVLLRRKRYTVGKKLGSNDLVTTYIAFDSKLKQRIALAEFAPEDLAARDNEEIVPRTGQDKAYDKARNAFLKNARNMVELRDHPNMLRVMDLFREHNTVYYTMEMPEGEGLSGFLSRKHKISGEQAAQILLPMMDVLSYAHSRKMFHHDLRLNSIMLCRDSVQPNAVTPKLIDFGSVHVDFGEDVQADLEEESSSFISLEGDGSQAGHNAWIDVYALCAIFYRAIVGIVPTPAQYRAQHARDPLMFPREMGADVSLDMQEVIMRGLSLQRDEQILTMDDLIARILQASGPEKSGMQAFSWQKIPQMKRPVFRRIASWALEMVILTAGIVFLMESNLLSELGLDLDPRVLALLAAPDLLLLINILLSVIAGAPLGQLIFGLQLQNEDGERKPGLGSAFAYSLLRTSFGFPVGLVCGVIWLLSGKNIGPLEKMTGVSVQRRDKMTLPLGQSHLILEQPAEQVQNSASGEDVIHTAAGNDPSGSDNPEFWHQMAIEKTVDAGMTLPGLNEDPVTLSEENTVTQLSPADGMVTEPQSVEAEKKRPSALLVCIQTGDTAAPLRGKAVMVTDGNSIGKNSQRAMILIPDKTVSGLHCSLHFEEGKGWTVKDEKSTNGTFINRVKVPSGGSAPLKSGDQIVIGKETFMFKC